MGGMICNNFLLSDLRLGGLPAGGFHEDTRKVEAGAAGTGHQVGPLRLWRLWIVYTDEAYNIKKTVELPTAVSQLT